MDSNDKDENTLCSGKNCTFNLSEKGAQSIYCDICAELFCIKCMGILKKYFDAVTCSANIKMVCNQCLTFLFTSLCKGKKDENRIGVHDKEMKEKISKMEKIITNFEEIGHKMEERINEQITKKLGSLSEIHEKLDSLAILPTKIENTLDNIPKEMDKMKESYSRILEKNISEKNEEAIAQNVGMIVKNTLNENKQANEKEDEIEKSVIINCIQEEDIKNYDKRLESDRTKISELIKEGIQIPMPEISNIQRLGKYDSKRSLPRPIRVIFKDKLERNKVIRNASNLKEADDKYKRCYINRAMNIEEKKDYTEQIRKAKEMSEKYKDENKFYVVRGRPSKWKIEERKMKE